MEYKSIKGYSGWGQVGILFVFLGAGFILTGLVQAAIIFNLLPAGTSFNDMGKMMETVLFDPKNVGALRLSQVLGTFCFFFLPAICYSLVVNGKNMFWLGFNPWFRGAQIALAFGIIYAANVCAGPLADWTKMLLAHFPSLDSIAKKMEDAYNAQVLAMSNLTSWSEFIMAIFIMAFFPALFEEVFFRGAMQNLLVKWWKKPLVAIIATSVIFSLIHMSLYLFLSRAVLGFALGLLYHKSKNLWVNIIAHFLNNAIAVTTLFALSRKGKMPDLSKIDPKMEWYFGLIGLAGLIGLFILFDRASKNNIAKIEAREAALLAEHNALQCFPEKINYDHGAE